MIREHFEILLEELLNKTRDFYGKRLVALAVFGSVGRGCPRPDSDTDILLIAEDLPSGRLKRMAEFEEGVEKKLAPLLKGLKEAGIDTYLSPVIKTPQEAERGSPLFLDMVEDCKILYDRQGFFKNCLEKLQKRLLELGAQRIWRGNSWHWVLKKDWEKGEIFKL